MKYTTWFWQQVFHGYTLEQQEKAKFKIGAIVQVVGHPCPREDEGVIVDKDYMPNSWIIANSKGVKLPCREEYLKVIGQLT